MQLMDKWLQKIFVYSLLYYFFVYFRFVSTLFYLMKLSSSFIVWLTLRTVISKSSKSYPNHIYVLKWYILYCLICFGFFECLYMHLLWQRKQEITRMRELEVELTLSPRVWGSRFSVSSLVYSVKRPINYCCRICTVLCTILKKRQFIEALWRPSFTKYAHCKPLFPFQNNA